jgi:hypothetical protein
MEVKRRDFIRSMAVIGAGAFTFNPVLGAFSKAKSEAAGLAVGDWYASTCQGFYPGWKSC